MTLPPSFDATARRSPLTDVALPAGVREVPFLAHVDVRADPRDGALMARLRSAIGVAPPTEPNTVAGGPDGWAVLWLGPDEWLVVGPPGTEGELEAALRAGLDGADGSVVDVSANRTTIELSGPDARAILASGCSIDLHPRAFGPGRCAQTLVARANVILWQADSARFRLLVRPSFAGYLAGWLSDAATP